MILSSTGPVIVTGTDTGVGKTIATAALAVVARAAGKTVAVVKPVQTGDDDDAATIERLAEPDQVATLARFPDPMSPYAAARHRGLPQLPLAEVVEFVAALDKDLILIEGAGGLLVPMGTYSWTMAELCQQLNAPAVVVVRAGLGSINHTALTLEALRSRGILSSVIIGSWPRTPGPVEQANQIDLSDMSYGLAGIIPEGAGSLSPEEFRARASGWIQPS